MTLIEVIVSAAIIALVSLTVFSAFQTFLTTQQQANQNKTDAESVEAQIATSSDPATSVSNALGLPGGFSLPSTVDTYTDGRRSYTTIEGKDPVEVQTLYFGEGAGTMPYGFEAGTSGGVMTYDILASGSYKLEAWGAQGGAAGPNSGFEGAYAVSFVELAEGDTLSLLAGGAGGYAAGGGGSFIVKVVDGTTYTPLCIAGGGGGMGGPYIWSHPDDQNQNSREHPNYGQSGTSGGSVKTGSASGNALGGGTEGSGGSWGNTTGGSGGGGMFTDGKAYPLASSLGLGGESFLSGGGGGAAPTDSTYNKSYSHNGTSYVPGTGGLGGGGGGLNNSKDTAIGLFRGGGGGGYSGGQGGSYEADLVRNAGGGGGGSYFTGDDSYALAGYEYMPDPLNANGTILGSAGGGFIRISYLGD
jgi:type II secretory pathway pseudopilin PulG